MSMEMCQDTMPSMGIKLDLPELREALRQSPDALTVLSTETVRRYHMGDLPAQLLWAISNPKIAAALHQIAKRLTPVEREAIRAATERKPRKR